MRVIMSLRHTMRDLSVNTGGRAIPGINNSLSEMRADLCMMFLFNLSWQQGKQINMPTHYAHIATQARTLDAHIKRATHD